MQESKMATIQDYYDLDDFLTGSFSIPSSEQGEYPYSTDVAKADGSPLPLNSSIGVFRPGWNSPDNPLAITQIGMLTRDDDYSFSGILYQDDPATTEIDGGVPGDSLTFLIYDGSDNQVHLTNASPYTFTGQASDFPDLGTLREGSALVPEPSTAIILGGAMACAAGYAIGKRVLGNAVRGTKRKISGLVEKLL